MEIMMLLSLILSNVLTFHLPENATDNIIISNAANIWELMVFVIACVFVLIVMDKLRKMLNVHE